MLNPALTQLWWTQVRARGRKLTRSVWTPRRAALSLLGLLLGCVWLSAAVLDVLFREPFGAERVYRMMVSGLTSYTLWHLVRRVWERPEQAVDWTPAEQDIIGGGPFNEAERMGYRVLTIFSAAWLKTACFVLLMWPDMQKPAWGFLGVLGGLMLVDCFRMMIEAWTWSLSKVAFRWARIVVTGGVGVIAVSCLAAALQLPGVWDWERGIAPWVLVRSASQIALTFGTNDWGCWVTAPFAPFGHLVVGHGASVSLLGFALLGLAELALSAAGVARLERWLRQRVAEREAAEYDELVEQPGSSAARHAAASVPTGYPAFSSGSGATSREELSRQAAAMQSDSGRDSSTPIPVATAWRNVPPGAWALVWRQGRGLWHRLASILAGLLIATILILAPAFSGSNHRIGFAYVLGSLIFYSWVLLPANIKLDFRRDVERMYLLKMLPLPAWQIVASQIGVPIAILIVYQLATLACVALIHPVSAVWWWGSLLVLLPTNVAIVTLENLIFLWYPFRQNQEGIEVFIRTTLAFTGKSIVYGLGIGLLLLWAVAMKHLAHIPWNTTEGAMVFLAGVMVLTTAVSCGLFSLLVRAYRRFDPTTDIPT